MATTSSASAPHKKSSIGKIIGIILLVLILLVVVAYFVVTSAAFFKKVILPRVAASMNSSITVSDVSISPFSQVVLKNLVVTPNGKEQLLKADEVKARYNLRDIIGGKLTVDEATVLSPTITLVEAPDGSSNLDPITKSQEKKPTEKQPTAKKEEKPTVYNIHNVSLKNATIQQIKNSADGTRDTTELSNFNLAINQLVNGQPGKLDLSADVQKTIVPGAKSTNAHPASLRGKLAGAIDYKLTNDAQPESAKGSVRCDVSEATGEMADLAKLATILNCDLTPTDVRQLSLQFEQNGNRLGELRASGPFSLAKQEGNLKVELLSIDRRVLNLAGAPKGIDFNSTQISSTNNLVFAKSGKSISVNGQLNANQLSLTKTAEKQTTPTLNLVSAYEIAIDQDAKSALIQKFNLDGTQNGKKILHSAVSKPLPISWGGESATPENASLQLVVSDLNLDDWKSFMGENSLSGKANANLNLVSSQAGKQLALDLTSSINALTAKSGSNEISNADVELTAKATVADMKKLSLANYSAKLSQAGQTAVTLSGSGTVDIETHDADIKANVTGQLAPLFKIVVVPDVKATSGTLKFDGQITQAKEVKTVKGTFALADFSGSYDGSPLDRFAAKFDTDIEMNQDNLVIRKLSGDTQQAGQPGGTFDVKGNYNSAKKTGDIEAKLVEFNQNSLRPFLAKSLGEKQLVTISVNGNATAHLTENESALKGNLDVKNLVIRDPKKAANDAPLAAQFQLDGSMRKEVFDLKQFLVTLSPTQRAKNQLNITGQIDMSKTNAIKGNIVVQSESFDVTPFYDLYASTNKPASAETKPAATPNAPATASNEEPEAQHFPVDLLTANINIGSFYLREIEIKNWRGTAKIEGSRVVLNPFELSLNNAPVKVTADLNLGVKGYAYDFDASLNGVPLQPLADFMFPDKPGAYQGTIIANANIKGAGITGASLKKSLSGRTDLTFTNANIQVVGKSLKPFLTTIAVVLQTPELTASPVKWVTAQLKFGEGKIDVQNFEMQSDAFTANTKGEIPIADVLTNSPLGKMPINFGLSYSLAKKAHLTSSNTPTNYVMLPGFLYATGTLGDPKPGYDKTKLLGTALEKLGGKIPGVNEKTENLIQGLGGILTGNQPTNNATNATSSTNSTTTTNKPAEQLINNALQGLFNKKK